MPWCPLCREEYREGFTICSDCGVELVEELNPINQGSDRECETEAYLTTASNEVEADIIESLLKSYGIPILKKYEEAGAFLNVYMGFSTFGIKIFVPESKLEEARIIIEKGNNKKLQKESQEESGVYVDYDKKRRRGAWLILLVFTFILAVVIFNI